MLLVKRKILQSLTMKCTLATVAIFPIVGCAQTETVTEAPAVDVSATTSVVVPAQEGAALAAPSQELVNQRREELQKRCLRVSL